jgi:DNA mismatch endonuclease, patch repair protein
VSETAISHPSPQRSRNMAAVHRRDTRPEIALRRLLHAAGLRFRKDFRLDLPLGRVRPDIVFTRRKVAVFIDGCFWHVCPEHSSQPATNQAFWSLKLARNVERDRIADEVLEASGWTVVRVWEHEPVTDAAVRIAEIVRLA